MSLRLLRGGEWVALAGALGIVATLVAGWTPSPAWVVVALVLVAAAIGLWLAVATASGRVGLSVSAAVWTSAIGLVVLPVVLVRLLVRAGEADLTTVLGAVATAAVTVGGWWALRDERVDAARSAYTPPPARPTP